MFDPRSQVRSLGRVAVRDPGFAVLTTVAWGLLIVSRFAIDLLSLRRISRRLGSRMSETPAAALPEAAQVWRARRIRRAIKRATPHTPTTSNCYPQALTAHVLLRVFRLPSTFYYGAAFSEDERGLETHVWVRCGTDIVTGAPEYEGFGTVSAHAWIPQRSDVVEKPVVLDPPRTDG